MSWLGSQHRGCSIPSTWDIPFCCPNAAFLPGGSASFSPPAAKSLLEKLLLHQNPHSSSKRQVKEEQVSGDSPALSPWRLSPLGTPSCGQGSGCESPLGFGEGCRGPGWPQAAHRPQAEVTPLLPFQKGKQEPAVYLLCRQGARLGFLGLQPQTWAVCTAPGCFYCNGSTCGCTERKRCTCAHAHACTHTHVHAHTCTCMPTHAHAFPLHQLSPVISPTFICCFYNGGRSGRAMGPVTVGAGHTGSETPPPSSQYGLHRQQLGEWGRGGCFSVGLHGRQSLLHPSMAPEMPPGSTPVEAAWDGAGGTPQCPPSPCLCGSGEAGGQVHPVWASPHRGSL